MKLISNWGFILLSIYLILTGLVIVGGVAVPLAPMGLLAIVSGILILIGR